MHVKCIIKLCASRMDKDSTNVSFHKFPIDDWKCKKWMEALKLDKIKPRASICSKHFHQSDFINDVVKNRRRLYPSAIPYLAEHFEEPQRVFEIEEVSEMAMEIPIPSNTERVEKAGMKFGVSNQIVKIITLDNNMIPNKPLPSVVDPISTSNVLSKEEKIRLKVETLKRSECKSTIITLDNNVIPNKPLPSFDDHISTSNVLSKEETIRLKVETLRRSECKNKKKIKILQQKVRRQTNSLASLKQRASNLKQTKKNPRAAGKKIAVDHSNQSRTIQEVNIKPKAIPNSPKSNLAVPKNDVHDQSDILDTSNEVSELIEDRLIFEVNFKNEDIFIEYKDLVIEGLRLSLTDKGFFVLVEEDTKIQIFREFPIVEEEQEKTIESCDTTTNPMEFVIEVKSDPQTLTDIKPKTEVLQQHQDNFKPPSKDDHMNMSGLLMDKTQPLANVDTIQFQSSKEIHKQIFTLKTKKRKDDCMGPKQKKSCFNTIGKDHSLQTGPKPRNITNVNKTNKSMNLRPDRYHIEERFVPLQWKSIQIPQSFETHNNLGEVVDPLV